MAAPTLSEKLVAARQARGWSQHEALKRMPNVQDGTLWTLEGHNPRREPAQGGEVKLKTAIDLVAAYWPDINLDDFVGRTHLRFSSRDRTGKRYLKVNADARTDLQVPPA